MTPMQVATAYSSIANGGYKTQPYFIERIEDSKGDIVFQATPTLTPNAIARLDSKNLTIPPTETEEATIATPEVEGMQYETLTPAEPSRPTYIAAENIIDDRTIYIMHSILKDVIIRGTGRKAKALKRSDLAGKTGTTNDQKDAWFSGFNTETETTVWVGFDQPSTLGRREYGATAALPIWVDYMRVALENTPSATMKQPEGLITVKINTETGKLAKAGDRNTIFEIFRKEHAPQPENTVEGGAQPLEQPTSTEDIITAEDIF
jgi:penicillin-binding protein 1A